MAGFAAGAVYDAYQQTDGFTDFCQYDILQTLAAGAGGAAAASMAAIMLVSGVGLVGMGLQGVALGLFELGFSSTLTTTLWFTGSGAIELSVYGSNWITTSRQTNSLYTNPAHEAASRADTLQQSLPASSQGRVTMAAGVVENPNGTQQILIGTSEPNGYIRAPLRPLINPNETVVNGIGHAEENIINWAKANNQQVISIAAGRPICPMCARMILEADAIVASPQRPR